MLHFNEIAPLNKITENIFASITTWYSFQDVISVYFDKVLYIILYSYTQTYNGDLKGVKTTGLHLQI